MSGDQFATLIADLSRSCRAAALAWLVGARVAYLWDDRKRRRESDLAALKDFYGAYGEFFTTWKLWDSHKQSQERGYVLAEPPPDFQWRMLEQAEEAESEFEALLIKIASERRLVGRQKLLIRSFRQAYQSLRENIRKDKALAWWATEPVAMPERLQGFRQYQAFKALAEYFARQLDAPVRPPRWKRVLTRMRRALSRQDHRASDDRESIDALLSITSAESGWTEVAERELLTTPPRRTPVALLEENPAMTRELYDQVRDKLDLGHNPAAGLIFHAAGAGLKSWVAYDVWESRAAWNRFLVQRLQPAVKEVFTAAGLEMPPPHRQEIFELHALGMDLPRQ